MSRLRTQAGVWELIRAPWIDPNDLLSALEHELRHESKDFRTRLLIRDSLHALQKRWGSAQVWKRLAPDVFENAHSILDEDLGRAGFPLLEQHMADATDPQTILQFFRDLGRSIQTTATLNVGGSSALILRGLIRRGTDDIDAVDEVPSVLRMQYDLLNTLAAQYRLQLNHFQSHYLPSGWERRLESGGVFDKLIVFLVDPVDIFVGKLFSKREKDLGDLRALVGQLPRPVIEERLTTRCGGFLADAKLRELADNNWYVLFGDPLPA